MICERIQEHLPDYLAGTLPTAERTELLAHLEDCAECRHHTATLDSVWRHLTLMETLEEPNNLRPRFQEMLSAFQAGQASVRNVPRRAWWLMPFPAWAAAACGALLLLTGVAAGRCERSPQTVEYRQLKGEVESMRQLVTLSLLQQQSPGSRMRGVNYSYQMEKPDPQVETALLYTVNHDSNVNVRLSALDALQKFAGSPELSRALIDALPVQDSPLVQIGLIDLLVGRKEVDAVPTLRELSHSAGIHPAVRQRAQWGLNKLGAA